MKRTTKKDPGPDNGVSVFFKATGIKVGKLGQNSNKTKTTSGKREVGARGGPKGGPKAAKSVQRFGSGDHIWTRCSDVLNT